jgi:hypothetical protein
MCVVKEISTKTGVNLGSSYTVLCLAVLCLLLGSRGVFTVRIFLFLYGELTNFGVTGLTWRAREYMITDLNVKNHYVNKTQRIIYQ